MAYKKSFNRPQQFITAIILNACVIKQAWTAEYACFSGVIAETWTKSTDCDRRQLHKIFVIVCGLQLATSMLLCIAYIRWGRICYRCCCAHQNTTVTTTNLDEAADQRLYLEVQPEQATKRPFEVSRGASEVQDQVERLPSSRGSRVMSMLFAVFLLAYGNVETTYGSLVLPYCVRGLAMTETVGNRVAFVFWLSTAASRFVLIFVSGRISPARLLTVGVLVAAASLAVSAVLSVYPSIGARWSVWPCSALLGLGGATVFPGSISLAVVYVGGVSSRLLALLVASWTAGCVVGPMAAGSLFERHGAPWVVRYAFCASLCSAMVLLVIRRTYRQHFATNSAS